MKFPGRRKLKHYFPVSSPKPQLPSFEVRPELDTYVVGLDQTIVDVVANVSDEFLQKYGIGKGLSNLVEWIKYFRKESSFFPCLGIDAKKFTENSERGFVAFCDYILVQSCVKGKWVRFEF